MTDAPARRWTDYLPLDEIQAAARNPKGHDLAGLGRSFRDSGIVGSPQLDERTGRLVGGHGRVEQLAIQYAAGEEPPEGIEVGEQGRWRLPVERGWSSRDDAHAERTLLALNKIGADRWDDKRLLAEMLGDQADQQLLELTGFGADELDRLLRDEGLLAQDAAGLFSGSPAGGDRRPPAGGDDEDSGEAGPGSSAGGGDWVVVTWTVTTAERDEIRGAVRAAQEQFDTETSARAVLALCRWYLRQRESV